MNLKPCPFCGDPPALVAKDVAKKHWDVACGTPDCYLESGADWFDEMSVVVEKWNKRPNAPHEWPGAALSRTVPLDAVVGPHTQEE